MTQLTRNIKNKHNKGETLESFSLARNDCHTIQVLQRELDVRKRFNKERFSLPAARDPSVNNLKPSRGP